jgi:CheY-like chemotaxis protein
MTERLRLIEQTQRAERLDAIGTLAGGIAHDFNNLLSGMFGYIELARELATENPEQSSALDEAAQVFERARELTRQLLTFSKGGSPVRIAVDLRKLLTDCARFALSGSNVSLNLRLFPTLTTVAADPNQIWRVIDNLIRNAVQAMPQGGTITITAELVELVERRPPAGLLGTYAKVTVQDNGPGIPAQILPRVFDPFFTTKEHGSGLGLATAYSVVRKHDGHIEVTSSPGEGSKFDIYLPVAGHTVTSVAPAHERHGHKGVGRALVLDDEPYLCALFTRYLSRMGYEVTSVQNGEEAVAIFQRFESEGNPIRVAVLDLTIPGGMGGKEVIARVRPICPSLVAIAASGYSEDPVMANPEDYYFTASLGKPFSVNELEAVLNVHAVSTGHLTSASTHR